MTIPYLTKVVVAAPRVLFPPLLNALTQNDFGTSFSYPFRRKKNTYHPPRGVE